jgi:D-alanyl-D-alanine carboxypeptidase
MPLVSGFRSYSRQKTIYNNYVAIDGVTKADTYSARPGHSEHQTGLAFDVGAIDDNYGNTAAGKWLANNAHKYGFIIRYPKGKTHITGYKYEPWHIRYIGTNHATTIYNKQITLEEYLNVA